MLLCDYSCQGIYMSRATRLRSRLLIVWAPLADLLRLILSDGRFSVAGLLAKPIRLGTRTNRATLIGAPQRRRSPVEGGPIHVNVDEHGSYRAAWSGN